MHDSAVHLRNNDSITTFALRDYFAVFSYSRSR
jgi:hypothetical protein